MYNLVHLLCIFIQDLLIDFATLTTDTCSQTRLTILAFPSFTLYRPLSSLSTPSSSPCTEQLLQPTSYNKVFIQKKTLRNE